MNRYARAEQFSFNTTGFLTGFGMGSLELIEILGNGKAFETSGCQGCNRPYYNESPRQIPYNYPRPLTREEIEKAVAAVIEEPGFSAENTGKEEVFQCYHWSGRQHGIVNLYPTGICRQL